MKQSGAKPAWMALATAGLELASAVLFGLAAGHLVDRFLDSDKLIGLAFGALIGFGLGMVRFIVRANRITDQSVADQPVINDGNLKDETTAEANAPPNHKRQP